MYCTCLWQDLKILHSEIFHSVNVVHDNFYQKLHKRLCILPPLSRVKLWSSMMMMLLPTLPLCGIMVCEMLHPLVKAYCVVVRFLDVHFATFCGLLFLRMHLSMHTSTYVHA